MKNIQTSDSSWKYDVKSQPEKKNKTKHFSLTKLTKNKKSQ